MTKYSEQPEHLQNNNNIHQKHSQSLNNLLTVPKHRKQKQQNEQKVQQHLSPSSSLNNLTFPSQQQNIQKTIQQQHSPTSINSSVGNLSIKTASSCSCTVFPISTTEQISQITSFPVLIPKEEQICLYNENNNSTSLAFPSSSFVPQTLSEHQNNNNSYNCPTCNNKINVFEQEKQQKQSLKHSKNIIVIPPSSPSFEQKEKNLLKITSMPLPDRQNDGESSEDSGNNNHIKLLQHKLFEHYHTVAYTLVILTCFLAFCEYLYLRLASFIFPEPIIYRRKCEKHYNEVVYRNELHFASGLAIFLVMGIFQILCFFLLTISKKLLDVKRTTFSQVLSMEERLHNELVFAVRRTMFETLFPTFGIYLLCSSVIYCVIFYMVGLRDQIVHFGSSIIIYVFDACIILYFLAFPILCVIFHPEINCCRKSFSKICCCFTCVWQLQRRRRDRANAQQFGNSQSLQTNDEEFVVVAAQNSTASNSEETKNERQAADITFNDNNSSIDSKHRRQQQNLQSTLSEDEAISVGNDGRTGSFTGRRNNRLSDQQNINKEINFTIRTKQQKRVRTKSPMSGSNINYGSLERTKRQQQCSSSCETVDNYRISFSPTSLQNNEFKKELETIKDLKQSLDKQQKIKNSDNIYDKIYGKFCNKFCDDKNIDEKYKTEKTDNSTTKNTKSSILLTNPSAVINRKEISTQTEAVRRRLQQRRQSRYKRLTGSDELKGGKVLGQEKNEKEGEEEEKVKRRNNGEEEKKKEERKKRRNNEREETREEKKNEENGKDEEINEEEIGKKVDGINDEKRNKNRLYTEEEISINFKRDSEEDNINEDEISDYSDQIKYTNDNYDKRKKDHQIVKC